MMCSPLRGTDTPRLPLRPMPTPCAGSRLSARMLCSVCGSPRADLRLAFHRANGATSRRMAPTPARDGPLALERSKAADPWCAVGRDTERRVGNEGFELNSCRGLVGYLSVLLVPQVYPLVRRIVHREDCPWLAAARRRRYVTTSGCRCGDARVRRGGPGRK